MITRENRQHPSAGATRRLLGAALALCALIAPAASHALTPAAVTVPWLGDPNQPHQVYSGGQVVLQGVFVDLDTYNGLCFNSATWDPGDGSGPLPASGNARALERTHTYTGSPGQPFTAILSVTDCGGTTYTDTMKVIIQTQTLDVEVNMAIDKALWYLHKRFVLTNVTGASGPVPAGYWRSVSSVYDEAATGSTLQAFEINGHRESGDPTEDPYVNDVARGLRFALDRLRVRSIGPQLGGDPDSNANGIGLGIGRTTGGNHETYIGGQVIDALVASGTPSAVAITGDPTWVRGRSYQDIVQDMLDAYSFGATDTFPRGAWLYNWLNNTGCGSCADSSSSHWWAIGVLAAETWGLDAPQWLKDLNWTQAIPHWQRFQQDGNFNDCRCGYRDQFWVPWDNGRNVTPACMLMMIADDRPKTEPRFTCAEAFMERSFGAVTGNFYAMFQLAKALRLAQDETGQTSSIELLNGNTDWYGGPNGFATWLVANQQADGQWDSVLGVPSSWLRDDLSTAWGVIILSPTVFELGPIAACTSQPPIDGTLDLGGAATFDGSGSSHLDPEGEIVSYEWDFQDGSPTESGVSVQHSFTDVGIYAVELTVTDGNGLKDSTTCPIDVRAERIPPFADTGGPYQICLGDSLTLDGSGSRDLDTLVVSWEWDWSAPVGDFSPPDATGETVDASGVFNSVGLFDVALRVTDDDEFSSEDGQSPGPNSSTGFTTVNVIPADDPSCNQPPVALCEARTVDADASCQGTASIDNGSFDPDGADDIASIVETPEPPYELGDTSVSLTITDLRGESDTCSATVSVVDVTPPTVTCPATIELIAEAGCVHDIPEVWTASDDNCSVLSVDQSIAPGTSRGLGDHVVTVTATDGSGNVSELCTTTVSIIDPDNDDVCGTDDRCADTVIQEGVPTNKHGTNRWALTDPGDGDPFTFDTVGPNGSNRAYSTTDTGGCSCEQIIAECGYGKGHTKFGCSNSVMDWWTGLFDRAGQPKDQCH